MNALLTLSITLSLFVLAIVMLRFRAEHKQRLMSEHITNKMPSGLITVNRQGKITGHNPASERIFEGRLSSNAEFKNIVRESDTLQQLLDRCLTAGEVFTRVEFNAPVNPDYDKRIGINLSPVSNVKGQIEGAICLLSDLTEIVELQAQVKLKENFAALGEMSAGIAHEFKNSLATILGYAQMSLTETETETLQSYAREILKESQGLSVMVTDFLNFARPVTPTLHEVDLTELLDGVIADLRNLRPGTYKLSFHAQTPAVVPADPTLIRQVFLNLLINAVEALEGPGNVSVRVDRIRERDNDMARVIVEDDGRGIPSHEMTKIFFPFFTTKTHGTGLGLSLVQKIIFAHNGRVEAQNNDGRGARFIVTLPLKARDD